MRPLEVLRAATHPLHEHIDLGEFARAMRDASIPLPRYASFLRAVHLVLCGLEEAVELSGSSELRSAFRHGVERRARLARDLAYLQADLHGVDAAALHALVLTQQMRLDARRAVDSLWGYLYVIEGSQLGGLFQKKALAGRPELQAGGLAYLSGAGNDTQPQFRAFVAELEAALSGEVAPAVTGARHAFAGFEAIAQAVMSPALDRSWLTEPLNRDAGTHPIPSDVREVLAALRAGEESYRSWAYYGARYGERGLRFTRSDSCWLVTRTREEAPLALRHVRWLAGVLASRGMPTFLLEQHVELLHARLTAFLPEQAQLYQPLYAAAQSMRSERRALLDDARMHALAGSFAAEHAELSPREVGTLLVAAVLDEKRGFERAVESLLVWFEDTARFDDGFRAAAAALVSDARDAC